jgi:hypothetical protein
MISPNVRSLDALLPAAPRFFSGRIDKPTPNWAGGSNKEQIF